MALINLNDQVLELSGKIYSGNVSQTQRLIEGALDMANHLIVNLDNINAVDLSGVFMLYLIQERARKKSKRIILTGINNEAVQRAFRLAGVTINNAQA